MDRSYYADHALTIARHPSETDERMMLRVLAFALHAGPTCAFGRGLSTDDEPDLWQRDLTGAIALWIDVGQPDEKLVRRACGRARRGRRLHVRSRRGHVVGPRQGSLERARNLRGDERAGSRHGLDLASLAQRTMELQCTIQEGHVWLGSKRQRRWRSRSTTWRAPPARVRAA